MTILPLSLWNKHTYLQIQWSDSQKESNLAALTDIKVWMIAIPEYIYQTSPVFPNTSSSFSKSE